MAGSLFNNTHSVVFWPNVETIRKITLIEKTSSLKNLPLPAGRQERAGGIYLQCLYKYGLTYKCPRVIYSENIQA